MHNRCGWVQQMHERKYITTGVGAKSKSVEQVHEELNLPDAPWASELGVVHNYPHFHKRTKGTLGGGG